MWSPIRCAFLALPLLAIVAACGGGGGSGSGGSGGGGGLPPTPTPTPTAAPTPALTGTMALASGGSVAAGFTYANAPGGSSLVFSCGCSAQAGSGALASDSSYTLPASSPATPAAPNPTYTMVPGRNYVIVATAPTKAESWNLEFFGAVPPHNVDLGSPKGRGDVYTAAGALYVYTYAASALTDTAYDDWNLNSVLAWVNQMRTTPNAQETTLLNDIAAAQAAGNTIYPQPPSWNPTGPASTTIKTDLTAVHGSGDPALPTPCPLTGAGGSPNCTGAPPT